MVHRPTVLKRRTHRGQSQTGLVFYTKCDFDFVPLFPIHTDKNHAECHTFNCPLSCNQSYMYNEYVFGPFGRTRYRRKDNIKNYFRDIGWDNAVAQH